ncbi:PEP-CTERM sorting domain-containing protein [Betaproteobacteria bacterium SCN1]|jgi:hypothetical protein|nr:PEP-CTERM sorting domain-containing protein [Betaproteobacteria bacterium SCN1]
MNLLGKTLTGCAVAALWAGAANASMITVSMTVDNSYALYTGTLDGATTFIGSDGNWPTVETYHFTLSPGDYIYVVTDSDKSTAQGFLAQFNNLTDGYTFYSQDPQWQVTATGLGGAAPYSGSVSDIGLLTREILNANAGNNASGGWTNFTTGNSNGASPWGAMGGIDPDASWVWYAGGNCNTANPTIGGCDAGEWLVFRIAAAATPDNPVPDSHGVPEPASIALFGLGMLGLAAFRRRPAAN